MHTHGMDAGFGREETVDELRQRLNEMKRAMTERRLMKEEIDETINSRNNAAIIDSTFLSWIFGAALLVILSVSVYAFYNLYNAILKRFPSTHTEL